MLIVLKFSLLIQKLNNMANFTSQHLAFAGYAQTINKSNNNNETTERPYINKTEEMDVVNFCNQFLSKYNVPKTKTSFQKSRGLITAF